MSKVSFELGIDILLTVSAVGERVQPNSVFPVLVPDLHFHFVLANDKLFGWQMNVVISE